MLGCVVGCRLGRPGCEPKYEVLYEDGERVFVEASALREKCSVGASAAGKASVRDGVVPVPAAKLPTTVPAPTPATAMPLLSPARSSWQGRPVVTASSATRPALSSGPLPGVSSQAGIAAAANAEAVGTLHTSMGSGLPPPPRALQGRSGGWCPRRLFQPVEPGVAAGRVVFAAVVPAPPCSCQQPAPSLDGSPGCALHCAPGTGCRLCRPPPQWQQLQHAAFSLPSVPFDAYYGSPAPAAPAEPPNCMPRNGCTPTCEDPGSSRLGPRIVAVVLFLVILAFWSLMATGSNCSSSSTDRELPSWYLQMSPGCRVADCTPGAVLDSWCSVGMLMDLASLQTDRFSRWEF